MNSIPDSAPKRKPLLPQHAAHLAQFRITDNLLVGVYSGDNFEVRELIGANGDFPGEDLGGIVFEYHDPVTGYRNGARIRLDHPTEEKKYQSETGNKFLYFGPNAKDLLKDTTVPVIFAEAEKSVLALTAWAARHNRKYLIVATGGADGWKRKRGKVLTIDGKSKPETGPSLSLDLINFKDRPVLIAFDSNARTNPQVRRARQSFSKELVARGADVAFVEIPDDDGINGPDDLIAIRGDDVMLAALDQARGQSDTVSRLIVNSAGAPKAILANAVTILRDAAAWRGVLAFNEFTLYAIARREPPWPKPVDSNWTDVDDLRAADWLQHQGVEVNPRTTAEAVRTVAEENRVHPVKEYWAGLTWDGTDRLDTWLTAYLGVENTPFTNAVGRRWLISAVARIYRPGCQADYTLVLEGEQGKKKSSALRALTGDAWFTDNLSNLDNKDSRMELHGRLIVELAEMSNIRGAEVDRVKAFLTTRVDAFRPPYGRRTEQIPRSNIFAASVNKGSYLVDETGGRRFWPLRCGTIRAEEIAKDRDQLWAEAVALYKKDEPWWLEKDELESLATEEQEKRYESGVWDNEIEKWIENPKPATNSSYDEQTKQAYSVPIDAPFNSDANFVTVADILVHAIRKELRFLTQADRNAVARTLRHARWTEDRKTGETKLRGWKPPKVSE